MRVKKKDQIEQEIVRVTNRLSTAMQESRIPKGEDLRIYFKCYDHYRTHRISHMIPKAAKNIKNRLINFMINDLRFPARVSVDPINKEYGSSGLNFNKLVAIAINEKWVVCFHVEQEKHNGLKEINRQLLPNPVNKRAIADLFDKLIEEGKGTVNAYLNGRKFEDHFAKWLESHNKVNVN